MKTLAVFACHGDQVLSRLADPSDRERDTFASFTTTTNVAWLHTDASVLPRVHPRAGPMGRGERHNRTHYCGAYCFYGFHEDGLNSALRVASALGVQW